MEYILLNIKRLIKQSGFTTIELANKMKLTRQSVYNLTNSNSLPTLENLIKLYKILNIPVKSFFEEGEKASNMVNENSPEYGSMVEQLKNENEQLRDQIKFLQHIIEEKL